MMTSSTSWRRFFTTTTFYTKYMRKVLEDDLARDLIQAIDITWDGRTTPFYHNVELEPELYVDIRGHVDYTYRSTEDNTLSMTWVNVTIEEMTVQQYKDGEKNRYSSPQRGFREEVYRTIPNGNII